MSQFPPSSSQPPYEQPSQQWPAQPGYPPPRRPQPQQPVPHPPRGSQLQPQEWSQQQQQPDSSSISMHPQPQQSWPPQPQSPMPMLTPQQSWAQQSGPGMDQPRHYSSVSQPLTQPSQQRQWPPQGVSQPLMQAPPQQWSQPPISQPLTQAPPQQWSQQATFQPAIQSPPPQWSQPSASQPFVPSAPQSWQQLAPAYQPTMSPQVMQHPPAQPPAVSNRKRSRPLLLVSAALIGVLLLAVIGFVAWRSLGKTATTSTSSQSTQSTQHVQQKTLSGTIGKPIVVSTTWTVTISSVQGSTGTTLDTPSPGHIFLVVNVTIKNTTAFYQAASSSAMFSFKDSAGQIYAESMTFGHSPDGPVAPGRTISGQIAYQVPASAHSFTLQFTPNFDSSNVVRWVIKR